MKTVRFAEVVKRAGRPAMHALWVPPAEDRGLQSAIRQHRVATVHQELHGGRKDFAQVGFHEAPSAQYLVFPKSVQRFADGRIIAINYDLLAAPDAAAPESRAVARRPLVKTGRPKSSTESPRPAAESGAHGSSAERDPRTTADEPRARTQAQAEQTRSAPPDAVEDTPAPGGPRDRRQPANRASRAAARATPVKQTTQRPANRTPSRAHARLVAEVRRAMQELKAGKAVAAYERLGRAVSAPASA
jgi:hypothetical protein